MLNLSVFILVMTRALIIEKVHFVQAGNVASEIQEVLSKIGIIDPKYSRRNYRGLILPNQLKLLLISDAATKMSAASMTVAVGSMCDPEQIPGLAHLLERVLCRRIRTHPQLDDFQKYIFDHGGFFSTITKEGTQNFHFEILNEYFYPALSRFVEFFQDAVIDDFTINQEISILDSEHRYRNTDENRIIQLQKHLSKRDHPYNRFHEGNFQTLLTMPTSQRLSIREALMQFYSNWYSSDIMYLVVLGSENLYKMEKKVISIFGKLQVKTLPKGITMEPPWGPDEVKRKIYVVPIADEHILRLVFPIPDAVGKNEIGAVDFIIQYIGYEGRGGLLSELRDRLLCSTKLDTIAKYNMIPGNGMFVIELHLNEDALDRVDEAVTVVFQWIDLLKTEGIREWRLAEKNLMDVLKYQNKDREEPLDYVTTLNSNMAHHPMEQVFSATNKLHDPLDHSLVLQYLNYLQPENMNVFIISKSFEEVANEVEPWYGVRYKVEIIPDDIIEKWKTVVPLPELWMPPSNEFIPTNEDLQLNPLNSKHSNRLYTIRDWWLSRIWYRQVNQFGIPKTHVQFKLYIPASCVDATSTSLTEIYLDLIKMKFNEELYAAKLAGYEWNINMTNNCGIEVEIYGFNHKLHLLLQRFISGMVEVNIHSEDFEIFKKTRIRSLRNFETEQAHVQSDFYLKHLIMESGWTKEQLLLATQMLRVKDFKKFVSHQLFSRTFIEGSIIGNSSTQILEPERMKTYCFPFLGRLCKNLAFSLHQITIGNLSYCKALELAKIIDGPFQFQYGVHPLLLILPRQVELNDGLHYVYETFNKYHRDSSYLVYFQMNEETILKKPYFVADLFLQIVQDLCRTDLKKKENLGFLVSCKLVQENNILGFAILVQSDKHPWYIDSRVEQFLQTIHTILNIMSDEEFEAHKESLKAMYEHLADSKTLKTISHQYWYELTSQNYNPNYYNQDITLLQSVKRQHLVDFFEKYLDEKSNKRHKLAIHVISQVTNPTIPDDIEIDKNAVKIQDIVKFKSSLGLFRHPSRYDHISPPGSMWMMM